jgi:hypothetical protein
MGFLDYCKDVLMLSDMEIQEHCGVAVFPIISRLKLAQILELIDIIEDVLGGGLFESIPDKFQHELDQTSCMELEQCRQKMLKLHMDRNGNVIAAPKKDSTDPTATTSDTTSVLELFLNVLKDYILKQVGSETFKGESHPVKDWVS